MSHEANPETASTERHRIEHTNVGVSRGPFPTIPARIANTEVANIARSAISETGWWGVRLLITVADVISSRSVTKATVQAENPNTVTVLRHLGGASFGLA